MHTDDIIRVRDACISAGRVRHLSSPPPNSPFQSEISRNGRVPSVKVDLDRVKQRQRHAQGLNSDENRSSLLCERFRFFDGQLASEFKGFIVIFPPAFFFFTFVQLRPA